MIYVCVVSSCKKNVDTPTINNAQLPNVITIQASMITISSLKSGGTITNNGGDSILSKGIVWSISPNPTISQSFKTIDGGGNSSFISTVNNLHSSSTYYYRAYAINSVGVSYGNELTVTTLIPDVYIAGLGYNTPQVATLWKNETPTPLSIGSNFSHANCVFIKDTDVYVGGYINNGTTTNAAIWKNGVPTILPQGAAVNSITASGNDIYAAGNGSYVNGVGQNTTIARYWKNGTAVNIISPNTYSYLFGITVKGTDVYVVGSIFSGGPAGRMVATVWKNGIATSLTNGTNGADANDIFINGNDIYISGQEQIGPSYYPLLWKNNLSVILSTPTTYGRTGGVSVYNDTVYVVGTSASTDGTKDVATIWKNGVSSYLIATVPNKNSYATDIKFLGNDMFVSGIEVGTGARYWKNGIGQTLPSSATQGQGNAIFVK
jgi:hypothetical protein